jgi:hypothetical protein
MRKWAKVAAAVAVAACACVGTAAGITNGRLDANAHPNVGALYAIAPAEGFPDPLLFCSGSLVAPGVFVTAAHCVATIQSLPDAQVFVTFASQPGPSPSVASLIPGIGVIDPQYRGKEKDSHDIAVVRFEPRAAAGIEPVRLAPRGFLDALLNGRGRDKGDQGDEQKGRFVRSTQSAGGHDRRGGGGGNNSDDDSIYNGGRPDPLTFVDVGYGLVDIEADRDGIRRFAVSGAPRLRDDSWLVLSQRVEKGFGGTCTGDSGGPQFFGQYEVSITVTGDDNCVKRGVNLRLDIRSTREFLATQGVPVR